MMTKKTKIIMGAGATVLLAAAILLLAISKAFYTGPLDPPKPDGWARLTVGMTKAEVTALLGKPGATTSTAATGEYWEYSWTDSGDIPVPDLRAHVVWFGVDGRVTRCREPGDHGGQHPPAN